ncbi:MAG: FtsW/RodA/SpoVE family cell cycle protein [Muribaculaceae bacterium]|nr:FtsW/RodA/SpoVE family cell cycle protein [Muribaculaceae bacterium]
MKRDTEISEILINETLDGEPIAETGKSRKRGAGDSPKAAADATETHTANRYLSSKTSSKTVKKRPPIDKYIWGIYLCLLFVSIVELYSASSSEVTGSNIFGPLIRHCIFLGIGFVLVLWLQRLHYGYFSRFAWFMAGISFILLLIATFFGADINGAQRAIIIGGFTIQPPEIVKLTVLVLLATILARNQRPGGVSTGAVVLVALVVMTFGGLLWINGLTNMIIMMIVSIAMFLIGGIQLKKLAAVFVAYGLCLGAFVTIKNATPSSAEYDSIGQTENAEATIGRTATHEGRLSRYLKGVKPTDKIDDYNRQEMFARMAQANGGFIGPGPGHSRENARLPLAFSDYIYSIIVEDLGFLGGIGVLLLYLLLLGRAGRVAYKCNRAFPAFLIMGCAVLIVSQALVHMAIVTGVAPVSGQPLPFISKGGTSIIVMSMAIGVMLSVSRYAVVSKDRKANKEELSKLSDGLQAANYSAQ